MTIIRVHECDTTAALPTGVFHVVTADDDLAYRFQPGQGHPTLCGRTLAASDLPPSAFGPVGSEADVDPRYCPDCVCEGNRWVHRAPGDTAPGHDRSGPMGNLGSGDESGQHHKPERGRLTALGRSTDDGSPTTLLLVHEVDDSWTFHGLGAPGVTLAQADMVALAESILERAR